MPIDRRALLAGLPALLATPALAQAQAQAQGQAQPYPGSRPVTIVVPFPPGGSVDGVARLLARALAEETGGTFVVENRAGGAGGAVGSAQVLRSAPDGRTLLFNASILAVVPLINPNVTFDLVRDFTHVSLVADGPLIVSTAPNIPVASLGEYFAYMKANPGRLAIGTTGLGSAGHLAVEFLKRSAGVTADVVAYRGGGPALSDLAAGNINLLADPILSSLPLARGGQIKGLAVTSRTRSPLIPELPTVAESGMPPLEIGSWYGVWGPQGMDPALTNQISALIARVTATQAFRERLAALGFDAKSTSPEGLRDFVAKEIAAYKPVIEAANIKVE